ncbi:MAG: hypothetical protein QG622_2833 [Actinomycetota bacterium]|nr:hypothetical protein [Actinomycetota bacterium]
MTAVDAAEQMLAEAQTSCAGLPVRWVRGALPRLGFASGVFEAVVANFVINCVSDPRAAVRELARVVRPGGVVALTVWVSGRTAQSALMMEALQAAKVVPERGGGLPAGRDFERTVPGLIGLTRQAGLEPVRSRELAWDWVVSWEDWWTGIAGGVGSTGQAYLAQDPPTRERVYRHLRSRVEESEADGMLRLPSVAAYVLARSSPLRQSGRRHRGHRVDR